MPDTLTRFLNRFGAWLIPLGIVAGWYLTRALLLSESQRLVLPVPHEIIRQSILEPDIRNDLLSGFQTTLITTLVGLAISIVVGVALALAMSQARWLETGLFPPLIITQTIPILAITPLLGALFGFDIRARIIVVVIISIFPIITSTLFGLQNVAGDLHDQFSLHAASRWTRLKLLQIPSGLPSFFNGLRTAAGFAVTGAVVGEMLLRGGADRGLGSYMYIYYARGRYEEMWAALMVASLLGIAMFFIVRAIERKVTGNWTSIAATHGPRAQT
ncbi:MAG: ABC transporter permease [Acidimicrobiales bacterium]